MAVDADRLVLHLLPVRNFVPCPSCGVNSRRVHSRYWRRVWDLPWFNWPVQLVIRARRFFCDTAECLRRIFTEPFPNVLAHCSNAEMAARVARLLGFVVSPDTLIRLQRQEQFPCPQVRVLGVDEFALRRSHTYGTILVDLERHRPIDLLEGAEAEPFTQWLLHYPQVEVLARDRGWAYALAGHTALPNALQVTDRFHLVYNVGDALKELLHSRRWHSTGTAREGADGSPERQPTPGRQALWEAVQHRKGTGQSISAIARELGINRKTVSRYLAADRPPVQGARPPSPSKVRPHLTYLRQRWIQGCHSARKLYHELVQQGYTGSERHIREAVHPWRSAHGPPPTHGPSRNWMLRRPGQKLSCVEKEDLEHFLEANPVLAQGYRLKEWFHRVVRQRDLAALDDWLQEALESGIKPFQRVARGFRKDYAAIQAALTTPWSTAQCEGQNCRVKLIKRLGYGRAKPDLLRQRVLHRLAA
jgi:transposase/predicted transcriptional regulator